MSEHCIDCAPEFSECWDDGIKCRKRPSSLAAPLCSAIRPHAEQTTLERVLRSHLWYPNDILARGARELPKCVKSKEYREAADWQELMRKAEKEIKDWEHILALYESERQPPNDKVSHGPANARISDPAHKTP